jgi:flagellar secretion chaperone FliS
MMTQSSVAYRANQAYRGAAVTVPPLKGGIMLLNGAITFLQRSLQDQQAKRFEEGYENLTRATAILRGLSHHLDSSHGGAMADRLYQTYNSLIVACLRSYARPQAAENYRRIIASLSELREAWEFVDVTSARNAKAAGSSESLAR